MENHTKKCAGVCGRTLQELEKKDIAVLDDVIIADEPVTSICRECADNLKAALEIIEARDQK